jgi:hypothetical protein
MVTTSFTLRKTSAGFGSYTRKDSEDTALKSDGFVEVTNAVVATSTFSANVINTEEILLSWALSSLLVTSGEDPAPISLSIVSSTTGEPQTLKDGVLVHKTSSNTVSSYTDAVRVEKGQWVYYSLFAQYSDFESTPTIWYERLASLYIQIPKDYLSVNNLWARIPEYYRILDASQPGEPLYNFLELFGWEIDRFRSLVDSVALSNDPELAVPPALAELAYQMGLETTIEAVGPTKVRRLLNNITQVRKNKGTRDSVEYYLNALAGSMVSYSENLTNPLDPQYIFNVHSQRINFCADPTFNQELTTTATGTGATYRTSRTTSSTWGVYSYGETSTIGASVTTNGSALTITNVGTGTITALVYQKTPFPYYKAADLYTNFTPTISGSASFTNFHITETAVMTAWESGVSSGSVPPSLYYDTWNSTPNKFLQDVNHPEQERYEITSNSTLEETVSVVPVLTFSLGAGSSITLINWLVEPFSISEYFDGDTTEGGLIPTMAGAGTGTSDYRWAGTRNSSFSYYTLDYQRISTVTEDIIKNYIAPVTIKDNVTLNWNYYYGKT